MTEWQNDGMAEWRNRGMTEWQNGRIVEWQNGGMVEWQNGRMTEWQNGGMAEWRKGRNSDGFYLPYNTTLIFYSIKIATYLQQSALVIKYLPLLSYPIKVEHNHGGAVRRVQQHGLCDLDKTLPVALPRWGDRWMGRRILFHFINWPRNKII